MVCLLESIVSLQQNFGGIQDSLGKTAIEGKTGEKAKRDYL